MVKLHQHNDGGLDLWYFNINLSLQHFYRQCGWLMADGGWLMADGF
ncbi:MAG: hypothetical protein K0M63_00505 [Weeksellaceae bacterium]|nr:hypothetical protein [Weeksellaceae bacterium]